MAREPDKKVSQAKQFYEKGMKLSDIAKKLEKPEGTIRRWKSSYNWDKKQSERSDRNSERSEKESERSVRARGAPKGNQNAVGSHEGAPLRNQNNLKHGAYAQVYWDALEDEELAMIQNMHTNSEEYLLNQLQLFSIRERRLMKQIQEFRLNIKEKGSNSFGIKGIKRTNKKSDFDGKSEETNTEMEPLLNSIMTLEQELTKVQRAKTKALETLNRLRNDMRRLELEQQRLNPEEPEIEDDGFLEALKGSAAEDWEDEED